MLGLYRVDPLDQTIHIRLADLPLEWCEGEIPTPAGPIQMRWWKDGERLVYRLSTPPGFQVDVQSLGSRRAVRHPPPTEHD